jgi:hypothetical protein
MKFKALALPILSVLFAVGSFASNEKKLKSHYDTNKISFVQSSIENISKSCGGNKNVLVFLDLDNTLLAMKKPLGSDQWFTWQSKLLKKNEKKPESKFKVSKDFYTLLNITKELFLHREMRPVENKTIAFVKKLQKSGHKVVILTSRGGNNMEATLRELNKNSLDFSKSSLGKGSPEFFLPYGKASKKKQRKVLFTKGVFMTAGQHKGEMTQVLMKKFKTQSPCIVHVDDHEKHTSRVQETYEGLNTKAFTFRYGAEDSLVKDFHSSSKTQVHSEWIKFQKSFQAKKGIKLGIQTL